MDKILEDAYIVFYYSKHGNDNFDVALLEAEYQRVMIFLELKAKIPDNLFALVESLLVKKVIETISLARRSGQVVNGFEVVKGALISGKAQLLIQASDGSEKQLGKLRSPEGKNVYFNCLTQRELGLAFGRDYAIHAALTGGGLMKKVRCEATRLAGIRKLDKS